MNELQNLILEEQLLYETFLDTVKAFKNNV